MLNGSPMTLVAVGDFGGNDNDVYTSSPFLDDSGISFNAGSTEDFNIYYDPSMTSYFYCEHTAPFSCMTGDVQLTSFTLSTAVPEPGSFALISLGVLGFLVTRRVCSLKYAADVVVSDLTLSRSLGNLLWPGQQLHR